MKKQFFRLMENVLYMLLYRNKKGSAIVYNVKFVKNKKQKNKPKTFLVLHRTIYNTFSINLKNHVRIQVVL